MGVIGKIFKKKDEDKKPLKKEEPKAEVKVASSTPDPKTKVAPVAASPAKDESAEVKTEQKKEKPATAKPVVEKKPEKPSMKVEKRDDPQAYKVLIRPLVTEKATDLADLNKYCFVVPISTNKSEVAKKIINVYGVKPVKINFIRQKGKRVRHGRTFGKTKDYKKAIITLALEDKIDLYEGV